MPSARQRRPRLTDEQTSRRVLDAALAMLADEGLNLGLDHLRFEDVIRAADVSRTSAYRRWPTRDAFVEDVLVELARDSDLLEVAASVAAGAAAAAAEIGPALATPAGRHDLFVELLRLSFQADVEAMTGSPKFRTNLALRGAFLGVRSPRVRGEVVAALAAGVRRAADRGVAMLPGALALCGHRLSPALASPDGMGMLGRAAASASIGFALAGLADPALVTETRPLAPYGSTRTAQWSTPVLALCGIVMANVEPDPDAVAPRPDEVAGALAGLVGVGWSGGR